MTEQKNFKSTDNDILLEVLLLNDGFQSVKSYTETKKCKLCNETMKDAYCLIFKCNHAYHRNCILQDTLEKNKYQCTICEESDDDIKFLISSDDEDEEMKEFMKGIDSSDCNICYDEIEEKDGKQCGDCKSKYHKTCYDECMAKMNTKICPICDYKKNLKQKELIEEEDAGFDHLVREYGDM